MAFSKRNLLVLFTILGVGIVGVLGAWWWLSSKDRPAPNLPISDSEQTGFTFFNIGQRTILTKALRDALQEKLGPDAIETKTTIDLILPAEAEAVFQNHFQEVFSANRSLNHLYEERVEHDTTRLIYRYARKANIPIDYIQLLFDNHSKSPLFFSMMSKTDGGTTIKELSNKYGPPGVIDGGPQTGKTFFWKKDANILIATLTQNRIGMPEHYLGFYFMENIRALIDLESQQRKKHRGLGDAF